MSDFLLADDLSGALDAAAAFHHAGRRVRIVLSAENWPPPAEDEVVAVTTETRNASAGVAAEVIARVIARGRTIGARLVYKKIDSTLRGQVAAEIEALTSALPGVRVLFAPANPAAGRTVRDGVLLVHGVPVAETEFGRDPASPVRTSVIRELLGDVASERVRIADTTSEADLAAAVATMDAIDREWVGVGSGALARPIAARDARHDQKPAPRLACSTKAGPALMIAGSAHRLNRQEAAELRAARGVPVHELRVHATSLTAQDAITSIRQSGGAALLIEEQRHGDSAEVVRAVAATAAAVLKATGVRRVFVTGGETAFALCRQIDVSALTFAAEIEPGLSLSHAGDGDDAYWFAIKPGGFGDAQTWVRAWDALQGERAKGLS